MSSEDVELLLKYKYFSHGDFDVYLNGYGYLTVRYCGVIDSIMRCRPELGKGLIIELNHKL